MSCFGMASLFLRVRTEKGSLGCLYADLLTPSVIPLELLTATTPLRHCRKSRGGKVNFETSWFDAFLEKVMFKIYFLLVLSKWSGFGPVWL